MSKITLNPDSIYVRNHENFILGKEALFSFNRSISAVNDSLYGFQPTKDQQISGISIDDVLSGNKSSLCADVYYLDMNVGLLKGFAQRPFVVCSSTTERDEVATSPIAVYLTPVSDNEQKDLSGYIEWIFLFNRDMTWEDLIPYFSGKEYLSAARVSGYGDWEVIGSTTMTDEKMSGIINDVVTEKLDPITSEWDNKINDVEGRVSELESVSSTYLLTSGGVVDYLTINDGLNVGGGIHVYGDLDLYTGNLNLNEGKINASNFTLSSSNFGESIYTGEDSHIFANIFSLTAQSLSIETTSADFLKTTEYDNYIEAQIHKLSITNGLTAYTGSLGTYGLTVDVEGDSGFVSIDATKFSSPGISSGFNNDDLLINANSLTAGGISANDNQNGTHIKAADGEFTNFTIPRGLTSDASGTRVKIDAGLSVAGNGGHMLSANGHDINLCATYVSADSFFLSRLSGNSIGLSGDFDRFNAHGITATNNETFANVNYLTAGSAELTVDNLSAIGLTANANEGTRISANHFEIGKMASNAYIIADSDRVLIKGAELTARTLEVDGSFTASDNDVRINAISGSAFLSSINAAEISAESFLAPGVNINAQNKHGLSVSNIHFGDGSELSSVERLVNIDDLSNAIYPAISEYNYLLSANPQSISTIVEWNRALHSALLSVCFMLPTYGRKKEEEENTEVFSQHSESTNEPVFKRQKTSAQYKHFSNYL